MSQTDGEHKSLVQKYQEIEQFIEDYEKSSQVPEFHCKDNEATDYCNISRERLNQMSPEELGEAAIIVKKLAGHIQKLANREKALAKWAKANLDIMIESRLNQQGGWSFEERKLHAINESETTVKLEGIRLKCDMKATILDAQVFNLKDLGNSFMDYAQMRQKTKL